MTAERGAEEKAKRNRGRGQGNHELHGTLCWRGCGGHFAARDKERITTQLFQNNVPASCRQISLQNLLWECLQMLTLLCLCTTPLFDPLQARGFRGQGSGPLRVWSSCDVQPLPPVGGMYLDGFPRRFLGLLTQLCLQLFLDTPLHAAESSVQILQDCLHLRLLSLANTPDHTSRTINWSASRAIASRQGCDLKYGMQYICGAPSS